MQSEAPTGSKRVWLVAAALLPIVFLAAFLGYKKQKTTVPAQQAHAVLSPSPADGRVHTAEPSGEIQGVTWDDVIQWYPYPGAASYRVELFVKPGQVLWTETASAARVQVRTWLFPPELRQPLENHISIGYTITALDSSGNVLAKSTPVYFYISMFTRLLRGN